MQTLPGVNLNGKQVNTGGSKAEATPADLSEAETTPDDAGGSAGGGGAETPDAYR